MAATVNPLLTYNKLYPLGDLLDHEKEEEVVMVFTRENPGGSSQHGEGDGEGEGEGEGEGDCLYSSSFDRKYQAMQHKL